LKYEGYKQSEDCAGIHFDRCRIDNSSTRGRAFADNTSRYTTGTPFGAIDPARPGCAAAHPATSAGTVNATSASANDTPGIADVTSADNVTTANITTTANTTAADATGAADPASSAAASEAHTTPAVASTADRTSANESAVTVNLEHPQCRLSSNSDEALSFTC
jgi:hypothetical protein